MLSKAELYLVAVILLPLVLVATNRLRLDMAGILTALALAIAQYFGLPVLDASGSRNAIDGAFTGLAAPVTITLFSLFVLTRSLDRVGITRWIARRVLSLGHSSESKLILLLASTAAFLSLFMNNLAAGALTLPSAMDVSRRTKIRPSRFLIPVAYGSCLGGTATYFTTSNIIASDMLRAANPPQAPLHLLDFTPTGSLIAVAGLLYLYFFGARVLPDREPSVEQNVARHTGSDLEMTYELNERLWQVSLPPQSKFSGQTLFATGIGQRFGIAIIAIVRAKHAIFAPSPNEVLIDGDQMLMVGREDRIMQLSQDGLLITRDQGSRTLSAQGAVFAEAILIPNSYAEGHSLKELSFRSKYGMTAVAIRRGGRSFRTDVADIRLQYGDSILAVGSDDERLKLLQHSPDFLLLESDSSDQPIHWRRAAFAIVAIMAALAASIAGFPVHLAVLGAAALVMLFRIVGIQEIYRTMEWQAIILIAGMYPLSVAMVNTGLAQLVAGYVVYLASPFGALGLVAGSFLLTGLLSQIIAGQVTTLITAPILISAAIRLHVSPQAVAVAAAAACSAFFLTPLAHPVNVLMIGPANYRFGDFFKAGWALTIISFVMLLIGMKLFWGL